MMTHRLTRTVLSLALLVSLFATVLPAQPVLAISPDIVISQVYGGGGNSGATYTHDFIELYNRGTTVVSLAGWSVQYASATGTGNFGANSGQLTPLSGTLAPGQYLLIQEATGGATGISLPTPDITDTTAINMSGTAGKVALVNIATTLGCNGGSTACSVFTMTTYIVDLVGYGNANFFEGSGAAPTLSNTTAALRNANGATDTDNNSADFTAGAPNPRNSNSGTPKLVINEIDYDQPSTDTAEFVEIKNVGTASADLSGYALELVNGNAGGAVIYDTIVLPAVSLAAGDYFVVCANAATVANCDLDDSPDTNFIQNGSPDAVGLRQNGDLVDAVSYEGNTGAPYTEGSGAGLEDSGAGISGSIGRCMDGADTDQNDVDLEFAATGTPGEANACTPPPPQEMCGDPFTPIYTIQGIGASSPFSGTEVAIQGIVVGDFQNNASADSGNLNGFHVQDAAGDGDAASSDGIFVFAPGGADVAAGDGVRVRGGVSEFNGMTEITASQIWVCSSGNPLPAPASLSLPVTSVADFERYEGMRVTFPQALVISEYFNYDRFGEIVLTGERHLTPSGEFEPGPDAVAAAQAFVLDRITLDDGRSNQNPDPAIHPNGGVFTLTNLFRGGDTVANVTGVMDFSFGLYRIQPTQGADYASANPRPAAHDPVGGGLKVASFNVLNYFTTLDDGVNDICGPLANQECRGADDANEFARQRAKIVAAIAAINADVVGLIEIENHPADVPTADLVSGLNDALGAGTYAYIATGAVGTDAIRMAIIYKPATVSPLGAFAVLDSTVDPRFVDDLNRPAIAQTFQDNATGGIFTVAVNHLKSKGSDCNAVGDPDTGNGAGNCNLTRLAAAQALVDWLATDPTGSGDADFLIMGDLNSYDKEDPIDAIKLGADDTAGTGDDYADLVFNYLGEAAYSYVFDGQIGYLDHALANGALTPQVTGVTIWHINADEPDLIDYDTSFKQPAQDAIYEADPYRSSDHDPVIVGLAVCDSIAPTLSASVLPESLWPANHKYVDVTATVTADDNFDPNPTITLLSVTSNEPDNGLGDGDTANDIVIVDDFHFKLRAERAGNGTGRIYTITYQVSDACGNVAVQSVTVTVPLSKGN